MDAEAIKAAQAKTMETIMQVLFEYAEQFKAKGHKGSAFILVQAWFRMVRAETEFNKATEDLHELLKAAKATLKTQNHANN